MVLRRDSKDGTNAIDKNLNHGFKAYLRKLGNPGKDRAVLKQEDMRQRGDNSDNCKDLEAEEQHIRCSRLVCALGHRDSGRDRCKRDSLAFGDLDHLLCRGNRLFHANHPFHH